TLYDEAGHWLGDYDNTGAALQQAIWLDDLPVGLIANGNQLHYIEPDHLGTPRVVIEVVRNVPVWTWDLKSEAFGNSAPNQDPDLDVSSFVFDMRYPGQRYDAVSGLSYNYFRDYDPGTGRYLESDPIGLDGGISTFAYVDSSPLAGSDPSGLVKWTGTAAVGYAAFTPKFKKIPLKKFELGRITIELISECVDAKRTTVTLIGKADISTNNPVFKMQLGWFDAELEDGLASPNPQALAGSFRMETSGFASAKGTLVAGAATGSLSGKSVAGFKATGTTTIAPFSVETKNCECP
ncbi:RHS repeat-associated core domain-containing protein, partial [Pseudoxanthomonas sacheonensis]|uniref:RHS repeat-associated core domain-containing protein n=1 Tax=Pseudoxanthomonas sacheonensis TaxID=443615 RepID=UPI0013D0CD09